MYTNTKKLISGAIILVTTVISGTSAATNIGTGSVVGSGALNQNVVWNDTFPGTATGTINGLVIKAKIQPTLSMTISGSGIIDLGTLTSAAYSTGTVNIELGTNAVNGAVVTAASTNAGLQNLSDSGQVLNDSTTDGAADSYRFTSAIVGAPDSSIGTFTQTANLNTEVNSTAIRTLYTSNKPQALTGVDDFSFSVSARPNAQSPAGSYTDVIQVSVIGTF